MTSRPAIAAGAAAAVIVGASVPVTGLLQDYPLLTGQAMRYGLSAVVLLGWTFARGQRLPLPKLSDVPSLLALVAFGMLGFTGALLHAQRYAEPGFVAAMLGGTPVVLALASRRRSAVAVAGAGIVALGVVLLSGGGAWHGPGLLLAALAVAGEASFTLFAIGVVRRLGGVAVATWCCAIAAVSGAVLGTFLGGWRMPDPRQGLALVALAIVVTALAFGLWYFAVGRLGADRAGVLIGLMPVSGLLVSVLLGAQEFSALDLVGATVVAAGCAVGLSSARARPRAGTVETVPAP
ncbi:DMT family transporter [Umezawaea sp. Da 62-37]|uniref:DMT family transporter n=1 Tax=Umezawaea sp. Da 62-37 TaxID=3075927 RepID=UPI0028F70A0C|nr:DMT family transporter [Umezawaea sp. Da 62-37]WNV82347.1 DMT family transporter [Umezawaea sp. Da 62-37]